MGRAEFHSLSLTQRRKDSPQGTQNKARLVKVEMQVLTGFCISLLLGSPRRARSCLPKRTEPQAGLNWLRANKPWSRSSSLLTPTTELHAVKPSGAAYQSMSFAQLENLGLLMCIIQ